MPSTTRSTGHRAHGARGAGESAKVLPADVRQMHRSLVLQELYKSEPMSRADLARATGLTRVSISEVVGDLIELDLVSELGTRPGARVGKPAVLVTVKYDSRTIVCLDLSDETEFRGALINLGGEIVEYDSIRLNKERGDAATERVIALARQLVEKATAPVLGIGIGTPGVVNREGIVRNAPNLGWKDFDLTAAVSAALELPAYVANDADTAVLAENTFGEGDGAGLMLVQISHGVGAGILSDGILLRGAEGTAGEIGHVKVTDDNVPCPCGRIGCLEALVAAPRLRTRIDGKDTAHAAQELAAAGQLLGTVLAPIVQALGLFDVVLFGPKELLDGPLLAATEETVNATTTHFSDRPVVLRMAALDRDGVLIGAAAHVLGGELGLS